MARTRVANRTKAPGGGADGAAVNMNSLAGTPMYMAPEVIKNEKSGRLGSSDMWSLGCCLLEICTGRKPWSNLDNEW
jgi:mitogen-activated protein kinase kinase kinase